MIGPTLLKTTFSVYHFFFYSFTAFDGSERTTAGHVVSPGIAIVHHGFRSKEVRSEENKIFMSPNNITVLTVGCMTR